MQQKASVVRRAGSSLGISLALLTACGTSPVPQAAAPGPELQADRGKVASGAEGMVVSAHPLASEIGADVLRRGGNAADASVAVAFALSVVEPMMGGIGGSGSALVWDQGEQSSHYLDFYATAGADPDTTFAHYEGTRVTARGVGVPGTVRGLEQLHERFGSLPWEDLVDPAIRLAEAGFPVHALLARVIVDDSVKLHASSGSARIFWPGGSPLGAGETLRQPELGETLRLIRDNGSRGFHDGPVARDLVELVRQAGNPMTEEDLRSFEGRWRQPLCGEYRGRVVLSATPPQTGMQIVNVLHLLEGFDLGSLGRPVESSDAVHLLASAIRLGAVDRAMYVGDPDYAPVPAREMSSATYAERRRQLIDPAAMLAQVETGDPVREGSPEVSAACTPFLSTTNAAVAPATESRPVPVSTVTKDPSEFTQTTHFSVVDGSGNAIAFTFTMGPYFGTGSWVRGAFLNSGLFNFSGEEDRLNRVGPHRTAASTIAPTILLQDGRPEIVVGSPGGGDIPPAIIQTVVNLVDFGMSPFDAVRSPRITPALGPQIRMEAGFEPGVLAQLRGMGYELETFPPMSLTFGGVHLIVRTPGGIWTGAADPRRDGEARAP